MIQKILVVLLLTISFSSAFAKGAKRPAKKKAMIEFNYQVFKKLSRKEKLNYLTALRDLGNVIEAQKGKKTAYLNLEELLFPAADAADFLCFNGGLAYNATSEEACNKGEIPSTFSPRASSFFNCAAGTQRCSLSAGISVVDGKVQGACYPLNSGGGTGKATSNCNKVYGSDGVAKLEEVLSACQSGKGTISNCGDLIEGLKQDTSLLNQYCESGKYKSACAKTKSRVQKAFDIASGGGSGTEIPDPGVAGQGCSAADQHLVTSAMEKATGKGIDPKWLKMITMTEKACGGNYDVLAQLKKFGACDSGESNSTNLDSLLAQKPGTATAINKFLSGNDPSARDKALFQDFFGLSQAEYKKVFCNSGDTLAFGQALKTLKGSVADPETATNNGILNLIKSKPTWELKNMAPDIADSTLKTLMTNYVEAKELYTNKSRELEEAKAKCNGNVPAECNWDRVSSLRADLSALQTKLSDANTKVDARLNLKVQSGPGSGTSLTRQYLGEKVYSKYKKEYEENKDLAAVESGGMTQAARVQRDKMFRCASQAVNADFDKEALKLDVKSNFPSCNKTLFNGKGYNIYSSPRGALRFQKLSGSAECYVSDGKLTVDNSCPETKSSIRLTPAVSLGTGNTTTESTKFCLEHLNSNFMVNEFSCSSSSVPDNGGCPPGSVPVGNVDGDCKSAVAH